MILKEKILGFNHLTELMKDFCMTLLSDSYSKGECDIGNNGGQYLSERESLFMVKTSELDDERVKLVKSEINDYYPYKILIETNGDYESRFEIELNLDDLEENLPTKMIEDLDEEFYKFTNKYTEN